MEQITGRTAGAVAASIEAAVHAGELRPGDRLPPVRDLAVRLRVSATTVAAAYKILHARGLASGSGRRGTRVAARPPTPGARSRPYVPDGVVDLATGNPDPALLPPLDAALRSLDASPRLYDGPGVLPPLATFVRGELQADGVPAGRLTITAGGLDALERLLREYLRPGDGIAVEDPAFPGTLDLIAASGYVPIPCELDDEGPRPEALDAALAGRARAVIVTPRAQNPTGAAIGPSRAALLRDVLRRAPDALLIEDDHAGPVAGAPPVTLVDPARGRWAVIRSVSKFLGPDLRVAFVAGDALTIARVEGRLALGTRWVSHLLQHLVLALWSDPANARRLARAAGLYAHRREALLAALAARGVEARGASGLNVWVPLRDESAAAHALIERGWAVTPGERFRLRARPGIRVTTAALQPDDAGRFARDLEIILRGRAQGALA